MKITIDMPPITGCAARGCAYNIGEECHAGAITVGDGMRPMCDTFFDSRRRAHDGWPASGVGPCKISSCQHNVDLVCGAQEVTIGEDGGAARCLTMAL